MPERPNADSPDGKLERPSELQDHQISAGIHPSSPELVPSLDHMPVLEGMADHGKEAVLPVGAHLEGIKHEPVEAMLDALTQKPTDEPGAQTEAEGEASPPPDPKRWHKAAFGLVAAVVLGLAATYVASLQGGSTAATVDGLPVSAKRHAALVAQLRATYLSSTGLPVGAALPAEQEAQMRREAMGKLVEAALIEQEAKARGLRVTATEVDAKEKEVIDGFQGVDKFEAAIKQAGVSRADVRLRMEEGLRSEAVAIAVAGEGAMVKPEEALAYYKAHPAEFQMAEQRRASHILVATEGEAKAVIAKLKGGANFQELARSLSLDSGSGAQGGDLGFFGKGRMVGPFEDAAFKQKQGELSAPIKTRFGYHVIMVTGLKAAQVLPYEQVESALMQRMAARKRNELFAAWLNQRRQAARIQYGPGFDPLAAPPAGAMGSGVGEGAAPAPRGEDTRGHGASIPPASGTP